MKNNSKNFRSIKTGRYVESPAKRSQQLHDELYRAFDIFNEQYCNNELPKCLITIQSKGRKNALGWFWNGAWVDETGGTPEINISAEYTARGALGVLETLLHEMTHYYNAVKGTRDVTGSQYHNKHFKAAAEMFGLKVGRYPHRGWAQTSLLPETETFIERHVGPNEELFKQMRRRTEKRNRDDKYISLIVSAAIGPALKEAVQASDLSQKEFVQIALENKIAEHIN
jgi:hypothetical protein